MISAFKHIRLSGFNLLPQSVNGQTRLTLNNSGVAYFSELSTASGVLNTKIDVFSGTFQNFVNNAVNPISPTFTYTSGLLTSISYTGGQTKTFTYTSGVLTRLDYVNSGVTIRKTFNYTSGVLTSIAQVTL